MRCPASPPWVNTFNALCEALFVPIYQENLALYRRFIEDVKESGPSQIQTPMMQLGKHSKP
jgi:hypothetical protein